MLADGYWLLLHENDCKEVAAQQTGEVNVLNVLCCYTFHYCLASESVCRQAGIFHVTTSKCNNMLIISNNKETFSTALYSSL